MNYYVPGTEETDPKKIIMSLQQVHGNAATNTTNIATNTSAIAALQTGPLTSGNVATQADQETATSTTLAVTPGRQKYHPSSPKAWAYYTNSGTTYTLVAGYNVASLVRNSAGDVTITFSAAFSSVAFAVTANADSSTLMVSSFPVSASTATIRIRNAAAAATDSGFTFVAFGDQ